MNSVRVEAAVRAGLALGVLAAVVVAPVSGQRRSRRPRPEKIELTTKDGVQLAATYYASAQEQAAPVVLLHDYKESRATFDAFARQLQQPPPADESAGEAGEPYSFAVVTVDLRGHGDSTRQADRFGNVRELDAAKLRKQDFYAMVRGDMEQIRKYLVGKNDAGEINLNRLSLVGVGTGASVATLWAAVDWAAPPLAIGKQGQDVKALVLVSPRWKNRGLLLQDALQQPGVQRRVAMLLVYGGEDSRVKADVRRIHGQLERYHPEPESTAREDERDLVALAWPTSLQGSKLLKKIGEPAHQRIIDFLMQHAARPEHPWSKRRKL